MPIFLDVLAKRYNPTDIDSHIVALFYASPHSVPIVCTEMIGEDGYGKATVNGVEISKGKCVKFDFSPMPIYLLPVGEVAREFGRTYTVKLEGYKSASGKRFPTFTFKLKTAERLYDDGKYAQTDKIAKEVSDEGIVLLDNNGVLPLKEGGSVALTGQWKDFRITAIGAALIKPRWHLPVDEAIGRELTVSENADTAIHFISRGSGEGRDNRAIKGGYYLTDEEKTEIEKVKAMYKKVILVMSTGYPIEGEYIKNANFDGVIWCGFSGQAGSSSLTDILVGKVCPSGSLADTWALDYKQTPTAENFVNLKEDEIYVDDGKKFGAQVLYEEGVFVGYRYYEKFNKEVAYPFGHGLSYTQFKVEADGEFEKNVLRITAKVSNIGKTVGKKVVLAFVKSPDGNAESPIKTLAGFEKTKLLNCGEEELLTLEIPAKDFAVYDCEQKAFVLEKGEYGVFIGGSVNEAEEAFSFEIKEDIVIEKVSPFSTEKTAEIYQSGFDRFGKTEILPAKDAIKHPAEYVYHTAPLLEEHKGKPITFADLKEDESKLDDFVSQFSLKELVYFTVCDGSCYGIGQNGEAGRLPHSKRFGVPTYYMSDGNSGVNIKNNTTGFPSTNLLAGTFNKSLAYAVGEVIAKDSKENGIAINLGPAGNLHRNILCGRHPEYHSEDPILAGTMMAYQALGLEQNGVGATYKHLLANGMECERKRAHSVIGERALYELYLRVFDKAISLYKPSCVMTSYNPVNGLYPSENALLLQGILRKSWGFDGFIMTDWSSCDTADEIKSVNAGINLITPGDKKTKKLLYRAAKRGEIKKSVLQDSVKKLIKILLRCGYDKN